MDRIGRVCTAAALFALLLSAGCQRKEEFPVFQMERLENGAELLYIDGVRYQRDLTKYGEGQVCYHSDDDRYVWTPAEGIGEQIGVCGEGAEDGGGLAVYAVAGDDDRAFLYTFPRKFFSGGVESRLWMREDVSQVSVGPPSAETVSAVTVLFGEDEVGAEGEVEGEAEDRAVDKVENGTEDKAGDGGDASPSFQVDDPDLIAALLEAYLEACNGDRRLAEGPFLSSDGWSGGLLVLHHKDYPFLQSRLPYRCHPQEGRAVFYTDAIKAFALPGEWGELLEDYEDHER